jgi:hypothetical protein
MRTPYRTPLLASAIVLAGLGWLVPRAARADDITITLLALNSPDADPNLDDSWHELGSSEKSEFLNAAACTCREPFRIKMVKGALADYTGNIEIWTGPDCSNISNLTDRNSRCELINTTPASAFAQTSVLYQIIDGNQLEFPNAECDSREGTAQVWALIDHESNASYESVNQTEAFKADSELPPAPTGISSSGAENGVLVRWTLPVARLEDLKGFQVLCSLNGQPVLSKPPAAEFDLGTCHELPDLPDAGPDATAMPDASVADAGAVSDAGPVVDAGGAADAGPVVSTDIDPRFICSGLYSNSATSARVSLPSTVGINDTIQLTLVAIDDHRNALGLDAGSAHPQPVVDAWEEYEASGGQADNGFCFVATAAYGDYDHPFVRVLRDFRDGTLAKFGAGRAFIDWYYASSPPLADFIRRHPLARVAAQVALWPVVVAAGTWEYTTRGDKLILLLLVVLERARRRLKKRGQTVGGWLAARRRLAAAAAAAAVMLIGMRLAVAQGFDRSDSDDSDGSADGDEASDLPLSFWAFELKFGPYTPDVDGESGLATSRPYHRTFCEGDDSRCDNLMTQLELDWFFAHPYGQLGLAGMVGYTQNVSRAFLQNGDGTPDFTMRSPADNTAFRLIPTSLSLVYRFTYLADNTVIPLVPYAKAGLAYAMWWITKGDGSLSSTPGKGKAYGGTLGWTATIGVSFRADMLDPGATRSLQTEMGVEHAGFFFELNYADISGLGQSKRLHVGDGTWYAGINFEF